MRKFSAIAALVSFATFICFSVGAQEDSAQWEVKSLSQILPGLPEGKVDYDPTTGTARGTNGIYVKYGNAVLMADTASLNSQSGDVMADGHVHIETGEMLWVGDHITYNFKTHLMRSEQFRAGRAPVFMDGKNLSGNTTNKIYTAQHVYVTTDDVSDPAVRVRASRVIIVPGKYVEMWNAVLFLDGVPSFYFPYYRRNLGERANNLDFQPGYSSSYGPYLLSTYQWYCGTNADGNLHVDYRERRGLGLGPDVNLHLGQWGEVTAKYYYTHDDRPDSGTNGLPDFGNVPQNRQRVYFAWQATPATNLNLKAQVNYQTDPFLLHDFFQGEYTANPQPNTFVEANKYWDNWSLDAMSAPRVNGFFNQVERLPDVKLTGFRQQILDTPIYYESESSLGYYRSFIANTNGSFPNPLGAYTNSAARADTFHQLLLPWTFFNWLNLTPHVGGRFTYYSAQAASSEETYRKVFNTGIGVSFKATRLWAAATNSLLDLDGLRHVIEPSANYVYVPRPSTPTAQLPQFDGELPSLLLLPVDFPDYNDIDSIDSENVIRLGLRNTLQTKREGEVKNLLDWNMLLDWRLRPEAGQETFNDLYSKLEFRPRTWLTLESQLRYSLNDGELNLAFHQLTFTPNEKWSWGLGHWYLRAGTWGNGTWDGNNFITSTMFYRINDNWGLRATHDFNAENGHLQDQFYTIYRDLRSWTAAVTLRLSDNIDGPEDFTIAFNFSLKASPRTSLGDDAVNPYHLVGE